MIEKNTNLDVYTPNVASAEELNLMFVFVQGVVVLASVFTSIPIKNEFAFVKAPLSTLREALLAEVALLDCFVFTSLIRYGISRWFGASIS